LNDIQSVDSVGRKKSPLRCFISARRAQHSLPASRCRWMAGSPPEDKEKDDIPWKLKNQNLPPPDHLATVEAPPGIDGLAQTQTPLAQAILQRNCIDRSGLTC
jgi:hypothetical protein